MDRRYQVFISSTFFDLKEERQNVFNTLMRMDCIPAGMELFPALDEDQFEYIKKIIDDCDYYILIVGWRYGSISASGLSYTEKEYDYATSKGIKVLTFLHENADEIPRAKSETDPALDQKIREFRDKVSTGRLVQKWKTAADLPALVALSLPQTIKTFPAVGWVRGNKAMDSNILVEMNQLRKQNAELLALNSKLNTQSATRDLNLADMDEKFSISVMADKSLVGTASLTWNQIFSIISPYLVETPAEDTVRAKLAKFIATAYLSNNGARADLIDAVFQTIAIQLIALGLIERKRQMSVSNTMHTYWYITPRGERLMLELRAVRSAKTKPSEEKPS